MNLRFSFLVICAAAVGFSISASAEAPPVDISGAWKIDSQNGPVPVCGFKQVGNNLTGSCAGPNAQGTITGAMNGREVRWRWQWVTYAGKNAAAFEFVGTVGSDNTVTGVVERREIGFSVNFTAKRGFVALGPSRRRWDAFCFPTDYVDDYGVTRVKYAHEGCEYGPPVHLRAATQAPDQVAALSNFDPADVATARALFPAAFYPRPVPAEYQRMLLWLQDQRNVQLDRQQGNSYSVRVR